MIGKRWKSKNLEKNDGFESYGLLDWVSEIEAQKLKRKDWSAKIEATTIKAKISEALIYEAQLITKLKIRTCRETTSFDFYFYIAAILNPK